MIKLNIFLAALLLAVYAFGETAAQQRANYASLTNRARVALTAWNGSSDSKKFLAVYDVLRGCTSAAPRPDLQAQHCYDLAVALEAFGDTKEALAFYQHADTFALKAIARNDVYRSEGIRLHGLAVNGIGIIGLDK